MLKVKSKGRKSNAAKRHISNEMNKPRRSGICTAPVQQLESVISNSETENQKESYAKDILALKNYFKSVKTFKESIFGSLTESADESIEIDSETSNEPSLESIMTGDINRHQHYLYPMFQNDNLSIDSTLLNTSLRSIEPSYVTLIGSSQDNCVDAHFDRYIKNYKEIPNQSSTVISPLDISLRSIEPSIDTFILSSSEDSSLDPFIDIFLNL